MKGVNMNFFDFIISFVTPRQDFLDWLKSASLDQLKAEYEQLRLGWKKSSGERPQKMELINRELTRRANEKYLKEHPNAKARYREHGWYLPNDD